MDCLKIWLLRGANLAVFFLLGMIYTCLAFLVLGGIKLDVGSLVFVVFFSLCYVIPFLLVQITFQVCPLEYPFPWLPQHIAGTVIGMFGFLFLDISCSFSIAFYLWQHLSLYVVLVFLFLVFHTGCLLYVALFGKFLVFKTDSNSPYIHHYKPLQTDIGNSDLYMERLV